MKNLPNVRSHNCECGRDHREGLAQGHAANYWLDKLGLRVELANLREYEEFSFPSGLPGDSKKVSASGHKEAWELLATNSLGQSLIEHIKKL